MTEALIGLAVLLILAFLRIPIAFVMILVGFAGMAWVLNPVGALYNVGTTAYSAAINYELSAVPLFVLMGNFVARARLAAELYNASNAFLGHRKGGLAMATVVACGGFSAICGSSLATAAAMSKVAMPSMRKFNYSDRLATGSIAAGGTLGILIPPSVILVTVPIFFPLVRDLGFDPIWFGIVVVAVTEISLITPPVGLNVFVLRGLLPDVKAGTIFKGVTPFWIADLFRLVLIVSVPALSLRLPSFVV